MSDPSPLTDNVHLSDDEQKRLTQASDDDMDEEHKNYLAIIIGMLDRKEIDLLDPESIVKRPLYDTLDEMVRSQVDAALINITDMLSRIEQTYRDRSTPDASPELQGMIEHLWQMKNRVEDEYGDVYKI